MTALFFPHAQGVCSQSIFTTKMRHCVLLTLSLASAYSLGNGASLVGFHEAEVRGALELSRIGHC